MESFYIDVINITLNLQSVNTDNEIEIEVKGFIINYNKKNYIISVHQGYPIKNIIINDKKYDDFIVCSWCDLLIIPFVETNLFVFKHFVKKQIEPTDNYYLNSNKLKFIKTEFMEIGMIPNNPTIMYNIFKSINDINSGMPIYNEKYKLAGITSKIEQIEENIYYVYSIPVNYILTALSKLDNTKIYSLNEDIKNIYKINNYKIMCDKIYCIMHKAYIPVESYIAINGDINSEYHIILFNGRRKKTHLIEHYNNMTNNNIIVNNNNITLTLGFVNWLKILDEIELIEKILINNETDLKWDKYNIIS